VFWDVTIYNSFGEWLESPYSDPLTGQSCQDCHMPPVEYDYFVYPENGGLARDSERILSHQMPGVRDQEFMSDAVSLEVQAERAHGELLVEVVITNDNTGHYVPTDSPLRHMISIVDAFNDQGDLLVQSAGPVIPEWAGEEERLDGCLAGYPGKGFALVLRELWTNVSPTGSYWNPVVVESDTRLAPFETDRSSYIFKVDESVPVQVQVQLIYRRAFTDGPKRLAGPGYRNEGRLDCAPRRIVPKYVRFS
jgi:hypothetical protein